MKRNIATTTIPFKKRKMAKKSAVNNNASVYEWVCNGIDPLVQLERVKVFVCSTLSVACKWFIILHIEMLKDEISTNFFFRNKVKILLRNDQRGKQYDEAAKQIIDNIETFQTRGKEKQLYFIKL